MKELLGRVNYFIGNDPGKWRTNVPVYARVDYQEVYPGVDLMYYGNQRRLEYDFIVAPGADPGAIRLELDGAEELELGRRGDLIVRVTGGEVRLNKPLVYQEVEGARHEVSGAYQLRGGNQIGFEIGPYDPSRPLVIDPILVYSTYLGGSFGEAGAGIAVDSSGNAYVAGSTDSVDFPTVNPLATGAANSDVFVAKFDATGALVYSTYLGGSDSEGASSIAVDSSGSAYVTGMAKSTDFPTANPLLPALGRGSNDDDPDAFVTKLNADGSALVYSTYLGGGHRDEGFGIAVDASGNAYITGFTRSTDFPTTPGAFDRSCGTDGTCDAYLSWSRSSATPRSARPTLFSSTATTTCPATTTWPAGARLLCLLWEMLSGASR